MEDSSGQSLLFQSILLLILTLLYSLFSASEMALVSLDRSRGTKAEEGDKNLFACSKVLENPNNSYQPFKKLVPSQLLQGLVSPLLGAVIATWFDHAAWAKTAGSMISLVC